MGCHFLLHLSSFHVKGFTGTENEIWFLPMTPMMASAFFQRHPLLPASCSWTLDSTGLLLLTWWPQVISSLAVYLLHLKHTFSLLFHVSVQMSHVKEASLPRERKAPSSSFFGLLSVYFLHGSHYNLPFYRLLNSLFLIHCWPLECKLCDRRAGSGLSCSNWNFQCPQEYLAELATWQMCSSTKEWMKSPKG